MAHEVPAATLESLAQLGQVESRVPQDRWFGHQPRRLLDDFHSPAGCEAPDSSGVEHAGWRVHSDACIRMCLVCSVVGRFLDFELVIRRREGSEPSWW